MKQHSTKDFDFDRPDKRMPYTVPDGFFADLESKILAATVGAESKAEAGHADAIGIDAAESTGLKATKAGTLTAKHGRTLRRPMLRPSTHSRWFIAGAACIAAAVLTALTLLPRRSDPQPVTYAEVEQVFTQLTDEDQAELLALYRNDPFLNL